MSRTRILLTLALLSGLGVGVPSTAWAEKGTAKKAPNVAQEPPKGLKDSDKARAMRDLDLAQQLIQYGRSHKHAESLLVAAQILHNTPTAKLTAGSKVTTEAKETRASAPAKADNSPKALVAEAKKLSSSPQVASLAAATLRMLEEESRGAANGPQVDAFTIRPGQAITWNPITFLGGQLAVVHVNCGVYGNMVLEVYDEFGNLIRRDNVPANFYRVSWVPAFTGPFRVRLVNTDSITFACTLTTN